MGPRQSPLVVLRQGAQPIALAACSLALAAHGADVAASFSLSAARAALSAAVSQVYASGAMPAWAAWLAPPTAAENLPDASAGELRAACVSLGIAGLSSGVAALTGGLVAVIGERPPAEEVAIGRFPGPGCLLAILGFAGADAEQERAAGLLCGELMRAGLGVAVQPITHGGLLLALGRCCAESGVGCTAVVALSQPAADLIPQTAEREALLGAGPGRYLLAISAQRQADARILASERGIPLWPLGRTGGSELVLRSSDGTSSFTELVRIPVATLAAALQRR